MAYLTDNEPGFSLDTGQPPTELERLERAKKMLEWTRKIREEQERAGATEPTSDPTPGPVQRQSQTQDPFSARQSAGSPRAVTEDAPSPESAGFDRGLEQAREADDRRRPLRRGFSGLAGVLYTAAGQPQRSERAFQRARQVDPKVQRYLEEQGKLQQRQAREQQMEARGQQMEARDLGMQQKRQQMQMQEQQREAAQAQQQRQQNPDSDINRAARRVLGIEDESVAPFANPKLLEMMEGNSEFRRKMAAELAEERREAQRWKRQQDYELGQKKDYFDYTAEERRKRAALIGGHRLQAGQERYQSEEGGVRESSQLPDVGADIKTPGDAVYQSFLVRAREAGLEGEEYEQVKRMAAPLAGARNLSRSDPEGALSRSIEDYIKQAEANRDILQRAQAMGWDRRDDAPELTKPEAREAKTLAASHILGKKMVNQILEINRNADLIDRGMSAIGNPSQELADAFQFQRQLMVELRMLANMGVPQAKEMAMVLEEAPPLDSVAGAMRGEQIYKAFGKRLDDLVSSKMSVLGFNPQEGTLIRGGGESGSREGGGGQQRPEQRQAPSGAGSSDLGHTFTVTFQTPDGRTLETDGLTQRQVESLKQSDKVKVLGVQ